MIEIQPAPQAPETAINGLPEPEPDVDVMWGECLDCDVDCPWMRPAVSGD